MRALGDLSLSRPSLQGPAPRTQESRSLPQEAKGPTPPRPPGQHLSSGTRSRPSQGPGSRTLPLLTRHLFSVILEEVDSTFRDPRTQAFTKGPWSPAHFLPGTQEPGRNSRAPPAVAYLGHGSPRPPPPHEESARSGPAPSKGQRGFPPWILEFGPISLQGPRSKSYLSGPQVGASHPDVGDPA